MSAQIQREDGTWYVESMRQTHEVHEYLGSTWFGQPYTKSGRGFKNLEDEILFGVKISDRDLREDTVVIKITKEEAMHLAKTLLNEALSK